MSNPIELFISYSHRDEAFREELGKHLTPLIRRGLVKDWHDRKIVAGQEWDREIDAKLQTSAVIVLLVSPDFVHSEYCWTNEMARALQKHERGEAVVIPVFIRAVAFEGTPFAKIQGLPKDAKPVSTWNDQDEAWVDVVRGIGRAIDQLRLPRALPASEEKDFGGEGARPVQPLDRQPTILKWLGNEGEQLRNAFVEVFGECHRPFGNASLRIGGLSDDNAGVQWNAWYDPRNGRRWVGVNLEGMQYRNWPVSRLILRELDSPTLVGLVRQMGPLGSTDPVEVRWERDYWQVASRPQIKERAIGQTPTLVSRLTENLWRETLLEAAACLDPSGRGRATQEVTLARSGKRILGRVSPHLTIFYPATSAGSWQEFFREGKRRLQPFYEWATKRTA